MAIINSKYRPRVTAAGLNSSPLKQLHIMMGPFFMSRILNSRFLTLHVSLNDFFEALHDGTLFYEQDFKFQISNVTCFA